MLLLLIVSVFKFKRKNSYFGKRNMPLKFKLESSCGKSNYKKDMGEFIISR